MLDQANQSFINGVVTVIRWGFYFVVGIAILTAAFNLLSWIWKSLKPTNDKAELEKARKHMRDMGY